MANSPQICLNRGEPDHIKFILSRIVKMRLPCTFPLVPKTKLYEFLATAKEDEVRAEKNLT